MTRIQKIKKFIKENPEQAFEYAVLGTFAVGAVGLAFYLTKSAIDDINRVNNWILEETRKGNLVYQLIDGSYISVKH